MAYIYHIYIYNYIYTDIWKSLPLFLCVTEKRRPIAPWSLWKKKPEEATELALQTSPISTRPGKLIQKANWKMAIDL